MTFILSRVDREGGRCAVEIIGCGPSVSPDKAFHAHQERERRFWSPCFRVTGGAYVALRAENWVDAMIESRQPQYAYFRD